MYKLYIYYTTNTVVFIRLTKAQCFKELQLNKIGNDFKIIGDK